MIEFKGVSKKYSGNMIALSNINFFIDKGEFVFLVGPSGAGKSTILKLILKEEGPSSGEILVNGYDVTHMKPGDIPYYRRKLGVVFQDYKLLPEKTVYDNVAFALIVTGAQGSAIRKQVPMVLSLVGLSDKAYRYPRELSGGEQQRAAIARALVNNPTILIADEPTGNLDPDTAWGIMELISEINRRGTTVLVATHAKEIVTNMKKRVISLHKGNIVRDQTRGVYSDVVK
ncbi:MAG: cell division ATP-binding protein FtsE [Thermoanaerobacteraceae bacterium]|nr:cell division ATP-binding protein FtsE [Thermoanaerobacteraceae bacterium]